MFDFDEIEDDVRSKGVDSWRESEGNSIKIQEAAAARVAAAAKSVAIASLDDAAALAVTEAGSNGTVSRPAAVCPLPALLDSPWLGVTRHNPHAEVRLFCLLGVGVPAASFEAWASKGIHDRYPKVEAAVIELPGHGFHEGEPFFDYVACAESATAEISRIHFAQGLHHERELRPFALYGNSLGSRIAAEVAAALIGPNGERCEKLYVSGRGAPDILTLFPGGQSWGGTDIGHLQIGEVKELIIRMIGGSVSQDQRNKYARWLDSLEKGNPAELYSFAKATAGDMEMGTGPWRPGRTVGPEAVPFEFPLHYYHGGADENWPLQVEGRWDNLPETWARYTRGGFTWSTCPGATHGAMGAVDSPAFHLACEDLVLRRRSVDGHSG